MTRNSFFHMDNTDVTVIFERLKKALHLDSDVELASSLGFAYQAFSKRKLRGSLPREEIETLIHERGLNSSWVFSGDGPMFEGGEADAKREQDWHDLLQQIEAMTLHNETRGFVEPIVRGVVWGDSDKVERHLKEATGLTPQERAILRAYRAGDPGVKAALELIAKTGQAPSPSKSTMTFHGSVGHVIDGDMAVHGPMTLNVGRKAKKDKS